MISPQAMSTLKDWAQIAALATFLVGLLKAIYEIGESRKQRAEELR